MIRIIKTACLLKKGLFAATLAAAACLWNACSDDVDESAMYSFKGNTIASFLKDDGRFDKFYYLLTRVGFSDKSSSTIADLMAARGNYTCFIPTDEALQHYLDSVNHTSDFDITLINDSLAAAITRDCIIDNQNNEAYRSTDFVEGTLGTPCMNDRFISVSFAADSASSATYINNTSRIIEKDLEMENGMLHVVDQVLSFSTSTLPSLIESTPNLRIFGHLLRETGWEDHMTDYRDNDYEVNHPEKGYDLGNSLIDCPPHRYYGFTAFVEPDDVFKAKWGVEVRENENGEVVNWDEIMAKAEEMCRRYYPDATSDDLRDPDNAINQFVSYHLTPRSASYDKLVIHYNEIGMMYNRFDMLTINVPEYYETMGPQRRILKVTEGATTNGKRLNRYVQEYDLNTYAELNVPRPGLLINPTNEGYDQNALNGWYYTIDDILWYDPDVPGKVLNERMRYNISAMIPELQNGGHRRLPYYKEFNLPQGYSTSMYSSEESHVVYFSAYGQPWQSYQGDEFACVGQYDIFFKLPPVPYAGTYEVRLGFAANPMRGMAQIYLGTNRENLPAVGLPLDLRLYPYDVSVGSEPDDPEDEVATAAIDKRMRLHGYMKGPEFFGVGSTTGVTVSVRQYSQQNATRKILYTGHMNPTETYWLRFKSVLESTQTQLSLDYIEIVPKSVYNGSVPEDRW